MRSAAGYLFSRYARHVIVNIYHHAAMSRRLLFFSRLPSYGGGTYRQQREERAGIGRFMPSRHIEHDGYAAMSRC